MKWWKISKGKVAVLIGLVGAWALLELNECEVAPELFDGCLPHERSFLVKFILWVLVIGSPIVVWLMFHLKPDKDKDKES